MTVGYRKPLGVSLVVIAGILMLARVLTKDISFSDFIVPILFAVLGISLLARPYFIVDDHTLVLYALVGPFKKRYAFSSLTALKLEGQRVSLIEDNRTKHLKISSWLADQQDWQRFRAFVEQRQAVINRS
jgi:hypothetical protein